jgi:nucleoside-diphosphate-sugar epimerase
VKALVTGAGGFLGRRVAERLADDRREVRILLRRLSSGDAFGRFETAEGQLGDPASLRAAVEGCQAVVHCAARCDMTAPLNFFLENNVIGTANMLGAAKDAGARFFVHSSSASVVFRSGDLRGVDESVPYLDDPSMPYAYSKALAERLVLAANGPEFKTVALRPHLVWGPGDNHLLPRLAERARRGSLRLFSGGPYLVDAIYVDDAALAFKLALEALEAGEPVDGRAFFISQGEPRDVNFMINRLLEAAGVQPLKAGLPPKIGRAAAALIERFWKILRLEGEPPITVFSAKQASSSHWFDIDAARNLLGYRAEVTLEEGLRRLAAWCAENRAKGLAPEGAVRGGRAGESSQP